MKTLGNTKAIQSQRGYSLIELSLVLAVVAILLVGSLAGVQRILRSNTSNNTLKETTAAVAAVITQTMKLPDFTTVNTVAMSGLGLWDPARVTNAGLAAATVSHPFGGRVYVNSVNAAQGPYLVNQTLKYTLENVPREVCADLVQGLDTMAYSIAVRDSAAAAANPGTAAPAAATVVKAAGATNVTLATLSTNCSTAGNKDIDLIIARN